MTGANGPAADLNVNDLRAFLDETFGKNDRFEIERISGGQSNPTYFVTHGTERMVLRKKPSGPILPGAHAIDREFRVLSALHPVGVPVPRPILYHHDPGLLGTPFYLMERVVGRVFSDCALPGLEPEERRAQWRGSDSPPIPALDRLAEWLPENLPPDDGMVRLAHGDFRMGNMLFHPMEPRVVAILDWELSTLGHPLADLGFCVMPWHSAPEEYGGILGALGIPEEEEFVARYMKGAPGTAPLLPFHKVFALFRFSVIFVGIADRARAGNAAAENAAQVGLERFAKRALEIVDGGKHIL
jgi:aminoglycoside phosphotransferase (APT) family kinase protein